MQVTRFGPAASRGALAEQGDGDEPDKV